MFYKFSTQVQKKCGINTQAENTKQFFNIADGKRPDADRGPAAFDSIFFVQKGNIDMDVYRSSLDLTPEQYIDFLFVISLYVWYCVIPVSRGSNTGMLCGQNTIKLVIKNAHVDFIHPEHCEVN